MYEGGSSSNINAQIEVDRLAAHANPDPQPDPADEQAERMTRGARLVIGIAAVTGFTWFVAGPGWAAVAAVIGVAVALGAGRNVFSFVATQTGRGLQIEAPVTGLWLIDVVLGAPGASIYYDRDILTFQVTGDGVEATSQAMTVVLAIGVLAVVAVALVARLRGAPDAEVLALTALGLVSALIALNKVGSPQYVTWYVAPVLLGLATTRRFRFPAVLVLVMAVLTQLVYPWFYQLVIEAVPWAIGVLELRNLLELVLLAWTVGALLGAHAADRGRAVGEPSREADPVRS
jgi:hypothetical protein